MIKFELNREGVKELMKSDEMGVVLSEYAQRVMNNAGNSEDYRLDPYSGINRDNVSIMAINDKSIQDNYENNTLLKALGTVNDN